MQCILCIANVYVHSGRLAFVSLGVLVVSCYGLLLWENCIPVNNRLPIDVLLLSK